MTIFQNNENRIKCGQCYTEFDLNKNMNGCPLCGFGKNSGIKKEIKINNLIEDFNYLSIPSDIKLDKGKLILDDESKSVGLWGMFNDFFSGKAILRICANMLIKQKLDYIKLSDLIEKTKEVIIKNNLSHVKGFPKKMDSESSIGRLVYHFLYSYYKLGLFDAKLSDNSDKERLWNEKPDKILIKPTKEGLEFAKLKNTLLDEHNEDQVLTEEERAWLIKYLKDIDKKGFKEYSWLYDIYSFIKKGNNGKQDLWAWYKNNQKFINYIKGWSNKSDIPKKFEEQIDNLAQMFGSCKVSLLRELGVIKNKRDDYTIIGELK